MTRDFRLRQLIEKHFRIHGSWSALQAAIADAHDKAGGRRSRGVDRLKLQRLVEDPQADVSLRISELEALDDYLNTYHEGLAFLPIFVRPTLLPALVAQGQVHFLVGAREGNQTLSVSHFDTKAYADLVRQLNSQGPAVTSELDIVLSRPTREEARGILDEAWQGVLKKERAVVAIGSPVANHGTDLMLAQMFGCPAYEAPSPSRSYPRLAFVLPEAFLKDAFSSFVEGPDQLRRIDPSRVQEIRERRWALRVGDEVFVADSEDQTYGKTYGVIVAQRRANGHLWVVAAGLHGAGTHAAALALPGAEISLSSGRQGEDGPVHVRVVEARVTYTTSAKGTKIRKVEEARILKRPNLSFERQPPRPGPVQGAGEPPSGGIF